MNYCTISISWAQPAWPMPGTHYSPSAPHMPLSYTIPPFPPHTASLHRLRGTCTTQGPAVLSPVPQALPSQFLDNQDHLRPEPLHSCHLCPSVLGKLAWASLCYTPTSLPGSAVLSDHFPAHVYPLRFPLSLTCKSVVAGLFVLSIPFYA